jgi:glycine/D-amino acid oxidase-like deaminating enzyme
MTAHAPDFCHHQIVALDYIKKAHSGDAVATSFNIQPRASGHLVVGSSRQFDVETPSIDGPIMHDMLDLAGAFMPGLTSMRTERVWTGLRAATPDGLPIIGPHPSIPSLYLAAGHEGLGLTMSMATAELIADFAIGRAPQLDPAPYAPSRFKELLA